MGDGFRRSQRFGVIGVVVVAVLTAVIGLTLGSGPNPTPALILIFALVFGYVAVLLTLQRRDVDRAEAGAEIEALTATLAVTDPTLADERSLLAALALAPIDAEALARGRGATLGFARDSIGAGAKLTALIFCAVVPWQLFGFVWSIVVIVPIIAIYALWLAVRALAPGGTLDQGYAAADATLAPLGLTVTERPTVSARRRLAAPGAQTEISGAVAYAGTRHGRAVEVRIEGSGPTTTRLGGRFPEFMVKAVDERLRAETGAPAAVAEMLAPLRASTLWKGVTVVAGADGLLITRRRRGGEHWMRDLWLAERLAEASQGPSPERRS